ncbi:MAG TPA: aromatic amino acid ammonia-lyase [Streptosporangiaceae bacterium]|nr:aromatic amino acid ammonia-lyase [Streptosporangiaceae bacterium]
MTRDHIVIDGSSLTCGQVAAVARDAAPVRVADAAFEAARAAWRVVGEVSARRSVYGRNTGVGANRTVAVDDADAGEGHGLRLLRSHAAGAGPLLAPELARAMLVVRLNQIGAGGSGVDPALLPALADAVNRGFTPPVPLYGAIGTGDLTALASAGLCLLGERSWQPGTGPPPLFPLQSADALAFMSSNAATLGESALACCDLADLLRSTIVIAALSLLAVRGSLEPYAEPVHLACPHPGQQRVAASVRALTAGESLASARVQDPYGFRAFPQVHGPAVDSAGYTDGVVARELNAAGENPLVDARRHTVWHNGNFHAAYVGLALDGARAALFQTAALSAARLGMLVEPSFTGLNAFQADDVTSSGIMVLEYVAQSAAADIRRFATPAALGNAVLSRGVEEHAGFSTQSAHATSDAVSAYRVVLACELVAAVRALRIQARVPAGGELRHAYDVADAVLDPRMADRPLDGDVAAATGILGEYAPLCP